MKKARCYNFCDKIKGLVDFNNLIIYYTCTFILPSFDFFFWMVGEMMYKIIFFF